MKTEPYRLPDGRIVEIHADVSRGQPGISYTLKDGTGVMALSVLPVPCEGQWRMNGHVLGRYADGRWQWLCDDRLREHAILFIEGRLADLVAWRDGGGTATGHQLATMIG